MGDIHNLMSEAAHQHKLREGRVRTRNVEIELDTFHPDDADQLLRFHVTKQNVADRSNALMIYFPWDKEIAYSSFHKAMDGKPVYVGVVRTLEDLASATTCNPRQYLPDAPEYDNLAPWMKQVAGPKWWHGVLQPKCTLNVLNGWATGRSMRQEQLEDLKQRVADWWERVEAACAQADTVTRFHDAEGVRDDTVVHASCVRSWDTWIRDLIDNGMSLDEAKAWYLDVKSKLTFSRLNMIDLTDPKDPVDVYEGHKWDGYRTFFRDEWAQWFTERAALGFPLAVSKHMPESADMTPYEREGRWGDRRIEEGPKDVNSPIYKLCYRERIEPFWDAHARQVDELREIVAVSDDGQDWRAPTEREKRGWEDQSLANARYRFENDGESPDNSYTREVEEERLKLHQLEQQARLSPWSRDAQWQDDDVLDRALRAARHKYETALDDY